MNPIPLFSSLSQFFRSLCRKGGPFHEVAVGQNPVIVVNIKIGGKWMFIHPKMEP